MKNKILLISLSLFFLCTLSANAAPAPWGIAINQETNSCGGYWGGDEFKQNPLPEGWIALYPWSENWSMLRQIKECDLTGKDTAVNSKICCEKLKMNYVAENVGWKYNEKTETTNNNSQTDISTKHNNRSPLIFAILSILTLLVALVFVHKSKQL